MRLCYFKNIEIVLIEFHNEYVRTGHTKQHFLFIFGKIKKRNWLECCKHRKKSIAVLPLNNNCPNVRCKIRYAV